MNILHTVIEGSFETPDKMPNDTDQTSNHNGDTSVDTVQDSAKVEKGKGTGKAPRKAPAVGKKRAVARPYKRLDKNVLSVRINDMLMKQASLNAKLVLLNERLHAHKTEVDKRTEEGVESKNSEN